MLASDLIKRAILEEELLNPDTDLPEDADWEDFEDSEVYHEVTEEFRCSGEPTNLPTDSSRHYECYELAKKIGDQWVGWTYWYGGGKFGEPERIDWISGAYFLDCIEREILTTVREFTKRRG